jgi:protein-tyrosine phosphatase
MADSAAKPIRVLFVCHYNRRRSATAERVFSKDPGLDVRSAGSGREALVRVNERMLDWADVVFVMDDSQSRALGEQFPGHQGLAKIINLDVPDRWPFLHADLVALLRERATPHLERLRSF